MGIYMFKFDVLKDALERDAKNEKSEHDFGKNVIPMLLGEGKKLIAYKYKGYWKDVGTIKSLHEANLLMLDITKAKKRLGWKPRLDAKQCASLTSDWYKRYQKEDVYDICIDEIQKFLQ